MTRIESLILALTQNLLTVVRAAFTRSGVNGMVRNVMPVNWFLAFHLYVVVPVESVIV